MSKERFTAYGKGLLDTANNITKELLQALPTSFAVNILENKNEYIVEADFPGFQKENISINFSNNELTIVANKAEIPLNEGTTFVKKERPSGEYERSFVLLGVDKANMKATFTDGVLSIVLPKKEDFSSSHTIDIL